MFEIDSCNCDELNAEDNHYLLIQEIINRGNINTIFHNCKIDEISKRDKYYPSILHASMYNILHDIRKIIIIQIIQNENRELKKFVIMLDWYNKLFR